MNDTLTLHPAVRLRRLGPADRAAVLAHYRALPDDDRRLRFGHSAPAPLARYVQAMDFARDPVLAAQCAACGLAGIAHVPVVRGVAELGLSVLPAHRRHGVGLALARAALTAARHAGAHEFRLEFAPTNDAMRRIAQTLGMTISRDGIALAAHRALRPRAEAAALAA